MTNPSFTQTTFRLRNDDGNETAATWVANENANPTNGVAVNKNYRVRFRIDETASRAWSNKTWNLYYQLNGSGGYNPAGAGTPVIFSLSSNFADGANCTSQLSGGTGTFVTSNAGMKEASGGATNSGSAGYLFEVEYCVQFVGSSFSHGNTVQLRVHDGSSAIASYSNTPSFTVNNPVDNQPSFTKGKDTSTDNQPAYAKGGSTITDNQPCYLKGGIVVSDNQVSYTKGKSTLTDNQPCYLNGASLSSVDHQPAFMDTTGSILDVVSSTGRIKYSGDASSYGRAKAKLVPYSDQEVLLKFRFGSTSPTGIFRVFIRASDDWATTDAPTTAYEVEITDTGNWKLNRITSGSRTQIGSTVTWTSSTNWYWLKFNAVSKFIKAKIWQDGSSEPAWDIFVDDRTSGFTTDGILQLGYFRSAGGWKEMYVDSINLHASPKTNPYDNQPSYTKGGITSTDNQLVFTQGRDTLSDNQLAYLNGSQPAVPISDNQPAYLVGKSTISDNQPVYTKGQATLVDNQPAYVQGKDSLSDSQPAYANGVMGFVDGYGGDATSYIDTKVNSNNPTATYGYDDFVDAYNINTATPTNTLIKFDLSPLLGGVIVKATLYLYVYGGGWGADRDVSAYRILSANSYWTEGGASWAYQDGSHRWAGDVEGNGGSDAGCSVIGTDYSSTALGSSHYNSPDADGTEMAFELDVDEFNAMVNANHGIVVRTTTSGLAMAWYSSDPASALAPRLVVQYLPGAIDHQPAYVEGAGTPVVDNQPAYTKGQDSLVNNQSAYTKGQDSLSDNQPTYLKGYATLSDNQTVYLSGIAGLSDNQPSYVQGKDTLSDNQPSYTQGKSISSNNIPAYLTGGIQVSDNQLSYLQGKDTYSQNQVVYLEGTTGGISDHTPAYLVGKDTLTDNQTSYTRGKDTLSDNTTAYTFGFDTATNNLPVFLKGKDTLSDNQPVYLAGGVIVSDNTSVYTKGRDTITDHQPVFVNVEGETLNNIHVYTKGKDTSSDTQPVYLAGGLIVTDNQTVYTQGKDSQVDNIPAYMSVIGVISDNQLSFLRGKSTLTDNQISYLAGSLSVSDNLPAYLNATGNVASDNQPVYLKGIATITDNLLVFVQGKLTASDNQPVYLNGRLGTIDNQPAYLKGQSTLQDNQPVYLAGGIIVTDTQFAFTQGRVLLTDNQISYLRGKNTIQDTQPSYLSGRLGTTLNLPVYLMGQGGIVDNQPVFLKGGIIISDTLSAYMFAGGLSFGIVHAYTRGVRRGTPHIHLEGQADLDKSISGRISTSTTLRGEIDKDNITGEM